MLEMGSLLSNDKVSTALAEIEDWTITDFDHYMGGNIHAEF